MGQQGVNLFSSLISSSLSLCFSFARLGLLLYSSPSSFLPEMPYNGSAVIGGDKKPGRSHSDQQPQQHTVWGTTLACAAENNLHMTRHDPRNPIQEAPVLPLAPCLHTANTSSTGWPSPSHHADNNIDIVLKFANTICQQQMEPVLMRYLTSSGILGSSVQGGCVHTPQPWHYTVNVHFTWPSHPLPDWGEATFQSSG